MNANGTYHGDATLSIGRPRHFTTGQVTAELNHPTGDNGEIADGAAVAIASWYQAPGGTGLAFAQLANTGDVRLEDLADALSFEFQRYANDHALSCLTTWALHHPSRSDAVTS